MWLCYQPKTAQIKIKNELSSQQLEHNWGFKCSSCRSYIVNVFFFRVSLTMIHSGALEGLYEWNARSPSFPLSRSILVTSRAAAGDIYQQRIFILFLNEGWLFTDATTLEGKSWLIDEQSKVNLKISYQGATKIFNWRQYSHTNHSRPTDDAQVEKNSGKLSFSRSSHLPMFSSRNVCRIS